MANQILKAFLAAAERDGVTYLKVQGLDNVQMRAWHVSPHHIVAATTAERAISYSLSIGLVEQDGLFATATELSESELAEPCYTGDDDESWRQKTIGHFLAETDKERLLCETLPSKPA